MFWTSGDVSSTRANSQWTEQLLYSEYLAISISAHDFNIYLQKNHWGIKLTKRKSTHGLIHMHTVWALAPRFRQNVPITSIDSHCMPCS